MKESASETMLQRFRWMGGNGLLFLSQHAFGSDAFLHHGPARERADRIKRMCIAGSTAAGEVPRDGGTQTLENGTAKESASEPLLSTLDYPLATAWTEDGPHPTLTAVGLADAGFNARAARAAHPLRRLVLWSVYDIGMGYMFTR